MDPPSRRRLGTEKQPITENARAVLDCLELHRAGQMPAVLVAVSTRSG